MCDARALTRHPERLAAPKSDRHHWLRW